MTEAFMIIMFKFFVGMLCFFGKSKNIPEEIEDIGLFDVVKALWYKDYDPFDPKIHKKKYLTKFKGGRSVGWLFVVIALVFTGAILGSIYAFNDSDFFKCVPMSDFRSMGMSFIGILTGANFVTFSILCTAQLFNVSDMDQDRRTVVAEGVAYICIQLLLALGCFIIPAFNFPEVWKGGILIFAVIYMILIAINILFHIFALIIYSIHSRKNK